ncbi:MAG: shikimate kinase [Gammaproteobacteria bacterium]
MGSGKTAVGKRLARNLGLRFVDSDREIEKRSGVNIDFIFEKEGESGFRNREHEILSDLTQLSGVVLATGGGTIMDADNRRCLASNGTVVYLETSVHQQCARVGDAGNRPMIRTEDDLESRLTELMRLREPLYQEIADLTVVTDKRHVAAVTKDITRQLEQL